MTLGTINWDDLSTAVKAIIAGAGVVITATLGWAKMDHEKADRADVERNAQGINAVLQEVKTLTAQNEQIIRYICRKEPSSFGC